MSQIASYRCFLHFKCVLSRGLVAYARRDGLLRQGSLRAYSRYKFEYYPEDPMAFVAGLSEADRQKLKDSMQSYSIDKEDDHIEKPSNRKLRLGDQLGGCDLELLPLLAGHLDLVMWYGNLVVVIVMYQAALPFIGFGFFDNLIMITAGEYIDATIGVTLGISTMAAAAFGNTLSDLMGIGLSHFVERTCRRLGIPNPMLTAAEARWPTVKWMTLMGKCCGILLGCVIGMSPLLWFDSHHHS